MGRPAPPCGAALAPWRQAALASGYLSSIALPLKSATGTFDVLTIYAEERDAFNATEVTLLQELAARIHDLGKISVPAEILAKPGKLSAVVAAFLRLFAQKRFAFST